MLVSALEAASIGPADQYSSSAASSSHVKLLQRAEKAMLSMALQLVQAPEGPVVESYAWAALRSPPEATSRGWPEELCSQLTGAT